MITAQTIQAVRETVTAAKMRGRTIGFVPTMGALHEGHYSLIERARAECEMVVVSIFVNPLQFGQDEDLERYPIDLEADLAGCQERGVDLAFCPSVVEIYGDDAWTRVRVNQLSDRLCGQSRVDHFDGVCTVVAKLFGIVNPDRAYFGEKDYQQLLIVRKMVADLSFAVDVVACPTCREEDGLAISSRNRYLTPKQRQAANGIYQGLTKAVELVEAGRTEADELVKMIRDHIVAKGADRIEYVEVVDAVSLESLTQIDKPGRICAAAYFGETRLIDNVATGNVAINNVAVDAPSNAR